MVVAATMVTIIKRCLAVSYNHLAARGYRTSNIAQRFLQTNGLKAFINRFGLTMDVVGTSMHQVLLSGFG